MCGIASFATSRALFILLGMASEWCKMLCYAKSSCICWLIHLCSASIGKLQILIYLSHYIWGKNTTADAEIALVILLSEDKAYEICCVVRFTGWKYNVCLLIFLLIPNLSMSD